MLRTARYLAMPASLVLVSAAALSGVSSGVFAGRAAAVTRGVAAPPSQAGRAIQAMDIRTAAAGMATPTEIGRAGTSAGQAAAHRTSGPAPTQDRSAIGPDATVNGSAPTALASPSWFSSTQPLPPTARGYAFSAYDSGRDRDVMFGGFSDGIFINDTLEWDGTIWHRLATSGSPSTRDGEQMAYDAAINKSVLFGGWDGKSYLADTWTWDGSTWTKLTPATSPPARTQGRMVYDAKIGKVVLFGGVGSTVYNDTWTFDGTTWTKVNVTGPTARENQQMAYDQTNNVVVLYGGDTGVKSPKYDQDTWTFDGSFWSQQSPAHVPGPRASGGMAYNATLNRVVMFGGRSGQSLTDDMWMWTGTDWYSAAVPIVPGFRTHEVFLQAAGHGQDMVFGGLDSGNVALQDTQLYDWAALGHQKNYSFEKNPVSDRSHSEVNVSNGNLVVDSGDVKIAGVGLDLSLTRYYNSGTAQIGQDVGWGWAFDGGRDTYTSNLPDGSIVLFGLDGAGGQLYFHKKADGSYTTPDGLDADLKDSNGNLELTFRKNNEKLTFTPGLLASDQDRNGNKVSYAYDGSQQLTSITDTEGRTVTLTHNTDGTVSTITDSIGRIWRYGYSGGYLVSFTDPTGAITQYAYNSAGLLDQITDPDGNLTVVNYDSLLRVSSVVRATQTNPVSGPTTSYAYVQPDTSYWAKTKSTDASNHTTTYQSQYGGLVKKVTDAAGHSRNSDYTSDSNVSQLTDALSAAYTMQYDNASNLTKIQSPAGSGGATGAATTFTYQDSAHPFQPDSETDTQSNKTTFSYDTAGNLMTVAASGTTATNNYQGDGTTDCGAKKGELCNSVDANGHRVSYSYDGSGNVTKITRPSPLGATTITEDGVSRPSSVTDGKGQKTSYSYDADDRIAQVLFGGATTCVTTAGTCVQYTWDAAGNLVKRVDVTGTTTYTYDYANRPLSKTTPQGATSVTYDGVGNVTSYTDAGGTVHYGYDSVNNVTSVTEPSGAVTTMGYDNNNRRTSISYPNNVKVSISYDNAGRETKVSATRPSGSVFVSRTYSYQNPAGLDTELRWKTTDENGSATNYSYDPLNRLIGAVTTNSAGTQTASYSYGYDAVGDRTSGPEGSHTYNAADELTDAGYAYDADGNQTVDPSRSYSYNAINQTTSVVDGGVTLTLSYADGNSTERTKAGSTTYLNGLLGLTQQTGSATQSFTRDPSGNLVSMRTGGASYYYVVDAVGSVLRLTDASGNDVAAYTYDPFGQTTSATGTMASVNPYRFATGYFDSQTGLLKMGARYYDPKLGRWTQRDAMPTTIGDVGIGNSYLYAGADPISRSDPSGLWSLDLGLSLNWGPLHLSGGVSIDDQGDVNPFVGASAGVESSNELGVGPVADFHPTGENETGWSAGVSGCVSGICGSYGGDGGSYYYDLTGGTDATAGVRYTF